AVVSWSVPSCLASVLVVTAVSAGALLLRRRWPGLLAGWLSYLALLAPTMGLVRSGAYVAADRYSYLPLAGLAVLGAGGLCALNARATRRLAAAGAVVLAGLTVLTWQQCLVWRDSEALWTHALRHAAAQAPEAHLAL